MEVQHILPDYVVNSENICLFCRASSDALPYTLDLPMARNS